MAAKGGSVTAKALLDAFYTKTPGALSHFNHIIAKRGEGSWVWDTDGNKFLDMTSGIGVTSTGHCHPTVVEAVQKQAATIVHAQQNVFGAHEPVLALVERLSRIVPSHLSRFFFCNSGAEAVDNAIKVARAHTGKQNIIAFEGGYHGRTIGSMAITSSKTMYRQGFGPLMPGAFISHYPYCLHCKTMEARGNEGYTLAPDMAPFGKPEDRQCCGASLEALNWMLKMQTAPSETAAIILEPIMGEGGFLTPPPGFLSGLRKICDDNNIMLIADEVQSGAGRTGKWWGHQHFDDGAMEPDILIFAKGIASGYPLAGLATRDNMFDNCVPGSIGGTYGGNAVATAAAVATIDVIEKEGILANAEQRGIQLMKGLMALAKQHPCIIDVRGRGLMVGVEFGSLDGKCRNSPKKGFASAVVHAASRRGMLLMGAGARECIRFLPSLNITESEMAQAISVFGEALDEITKQ